jgi:hypothetical protein
MAAVDDNPLSRPPAATGSHAVRDADVGSGRFGSDGSQLTRARWVRMVLLVIGLALAALPAVLSAHRALADGWRPVADDPRLAVDASSFAAGHPPLLGAESTSLEDSTHIAPIYHPGPAQAWLFGAVQVVWPGTRSLVISAAALAAAAAAVVVLAASRIAGSWAALTVGAVVGQVAGRLGTPVLADIWNPYVAILPLAAAVSAAAASVFARWRPGLPLAVLFATVSVQSHFTYGPLLVAASAPAVILLALDRCARRAEDGAVGARLGSAAEPGGDGRAAPAADSRPGGYATRPQRPARLASLILAGVIGVVLWFPPVLSEATAKQSNAANLIRAATKGTGEAALGTGYALQVFDRVVGRPPPFGPPAVGNSIWAVPRSVTLRVSLRMMAVLLPMIAVLIYGMRRRDLLTKVIGASVLATDVVALGLLRFSTFSSGVALYQTRWLWSIVILHWGGLTVAVLHIGGRWSPRTRARWRSVVPMAIAAVAVIVVTALGTTLRPSAPAAIIPPEPREHMHSEAELQAGLRPVLRNRLRLTFRVSSLLSAPSVAALEVASSLITEGHDVKISAADAKLRNIFGGHHAARPGERSELLVVTDRRADADMRRRGFEPVTATPALSSAERRRLGALIRRFRAELSGNSLRWTPYGQVVHLSQPRPDVEELLRSNRLSVSVLTGELSGLLPSRKTLNDFSDLQRRSRPETSFMVWRRSGPTS